MSTVRRQTSETTIDISVTLGGGLAKVDTTDVFLDHMLTVFARYANLTLSVEASGDLRHHLIEDTGITLGSALAEEVPSTATRYGEALVPMDDALVQAAVDVGGRPYYDGSLPSSLYEHFLQSLAMHLKATLHVVVLRGSDPHHVVEAAIKAVGLALKMALTQGNDVFSTKGAVTVERPATGHVLDESGELG